MSSSSSSRGYEAALYVLQKVACSLSAVGSLMIISQVVRSEVNRRKTQQRLLLGISVINFQTSVVWIFTSLFMPADSGALLASGNEATCDAQGFVVQFSMAGILYMCALQLQYLLMIRYGWVEDDIAKRERWFHALPIAFGLATATAALALEQYNAANWDCWIASLPQDCTSSYVVNRGTTDLAETDCIRGDNANIYRFAFFYVPLWASILFCIMAMVLVYRTIEKSEATSRQYRFSLNISKSKRRLTVVRRDSGDDNNNKSKKKRKRKGGRVGAAGGVSNEVKRQSMRYSSAFFAVWAFPTITRIVQLFLRDDDDTPPILVLLSGTTIGLQGFFNALIYFRPRYNKCVKYKMWYRKVWALVHSTLFFCCYDDDYTKDSLDYVAGGSDGAKGQSPKHTTLLSGGVKNVSDSGEGGDEEKREVEDEWHDNSPSAISPAT